MCICISIGTASANLPGIRSHKYDFPRYSSSDSFTASFLQYGTQSARVSRIKRGHVTSDVAKGGPEV